MQADHLQCFDSTETVSDVILAHVVALFTWDMYRVLFLHAAQQ